MMDMCPVELERQLALNKGRGGAYPNMVMRGYAEQVRNAPVSLDIEQMSDSAEETYDCEREDASAVGNLEGKAKGETKINGRAAGAAARAQARVSPGSQRDRATPKTSHTRARQNKDVLEPLQEAPVGDSMLLNDGKQQVLDLTGAVRKAWEERGGTAVEITKPGSQPHRSRGLAP